MKFKSALVTQVSGSVGGMTGSHNRGGMYFRTRAIPTDPLSTMQQAMRMYLGNLSTAWTDVLSEAQRAAWNLYAANVTVIGPLGDAITLSGQMHFIRSNTARLQASLSQQNDAPTTYNIGETPMPSGITVTDSPDFDMTLPAITDGDYIVRIGKPQGAGIGFFRGPFRFQQTATGDITAGDTTAWPDPVIGQKIWFAVRRAYDDGRLSEQVIVGPYVVESGV